MARLLYVESSPRKSRSVSISAAKAFLEAYAAANPADTIDVGALESPAPAAFGAETDAPQRVDTVESPVHALDAADSPIREVRIDENLVSNVPISALVNSAEASETSDPDAVKSPVYAADANELPEIEPSEAGTVVAVSMGSELAIAAGESLLVEEENGGRFARVSGFDPKIVPAAAVPPANRIALRAMGPRA